ncbi:hypothetical protein B0J17DRAFT_627457 [Rhizoctonia solani]|nr:hypothetical protein B0J17DRAFT_627457 [Rhizoctonia solani]
MPAGNRFRKLRAWISLASDVASYDTADDINARPDAPQNVGSSSWAGTSDRRNLLEAALQSASPNSDTQVALGESTPVSSGDLDALYKDSRGVPCTPGGIRGYIPSVTALHAGYVTSNDGDHRGALHKKLEGANSGNTLKQTGKRMTFWHAIDVSRVTFSESHSPPGSVYWMNGMAGTGKTTIAYSLCQGLEIGYKLAASFFCSRALPECRDVNRVIPSIAYQLARFSHPFRFALCGTLEKDPDIYTRLPRLQFDALIVRPLLQVKNTLPDSLVVIIDALDECENKDSTGRILEVLLTKSANLPVKFVVSSRPEPEVRNEMTKQNDQTKSRVVLHELDREAVQADIETYLRAKPTEYQIAGLVQRAGILFIYAATVVRYIGYNDFQGNTRARLANVLSSAGSTEKKHKEIDELYTTILRAALDNPELESLEGRINDVITAELFYAARHWGSTYAMLRARPI